MVRMVAISRIASIAITVILSHFPYLLPYIVCYFKSIEIMYNNIEDEPQRFEKYWEMLELKPKLNFLRTG